MTKKKETNEPITEEGSSTAKKVENSTPSEKKTEADLYRFGKKDQGQNGGAAAASTGDSAPAPAASSSKQPAPSNNKSRFSQPKHEHYQVPEHPAPRDDGDDEEEEQEACMHPMHMAVLLFSFLSMMFCIVALATPNAYIIAEEDTTSFGLFRQCNNTDCSGVKYVDFVSPNCTRSKKDWKNRNIMSQAAVIIACIFCLASCVLTPLGKNVGPPSYVCIVTTALSFVFLFLGVLRFVYTYERYLFCNINYCELRRSFGKRLPAGCDASFGYSFALLVISTGGQIFATVFAIMRVCFKDWHLTKYVAPASPVKKATPKKKDVPAKKEASKEAQEEISEVKGDDKKKEEAAQAHTDRELKPVQSGGGTGSRQATPQGRKRSGSLTPQNRPTSPANRTSPQRSPQNRPVSPSRAAPPLPAAASSPEEEPLPPGNWVWDDECSLYWSEEEYLYLDPDTRHYYDPKSDQWYDPDLDKWYYGADK